MKRKVTALLLAMAFVLATVAPTLAAGNEKAAANKTATVSVEKTKSKWGPLGAVVRLLSPREKADKKELKDQNTKPEDTSKPEDESEEQKGEVTPKEDEKKADEDNDPKDGETTGEEQPAVVKHDFTFGFRNKSDQLLKGAEFTLTNDNDETSGKKLVTEEAPLKLQLEPGQYTLKMTKAPEGYDLSSDVKFEVKKTGGVTITDGKTVFAVEVEKEKKFLIVKAEEKQETNVIFSLQDIFGNELEGGMLQIKEKDDEKGTVKVIKEWKSVKQPATYTLEAGKSYEFVQMEAPEGYEKAESIKFAIDEKGKVEGAKVVGDDNILIMVNDYKEGHIFYSVQDIARNELAGAILRIVERDGKLVESWTTDKTPRSIKLDPGSYRLELVQGPQGNEVAEAVDFTISGDGKIEAETEGHLEKFKNHKMLFLRAKDKEINFYFGLRDILDRELAGGQLQIRDQVTGKVVKEWTSGSAPKGFRLEAGKYTLVQVTAPKGYTVARSVDFEITAEGKIIADSAHLKLFGDRKILTLVNACKNNMVEFSKVTPEGKALSGASLEIYKDTTKLASWKSDAGLYRMEFEPGTYRFHEVAAPQGYKPVSDFEFEVKADGTITLGTIQNGESVALKNGRIIVTDQVDKPAPTENKKPESNTNKDQSYWVEFDVAKKDGTLLDGAVVEIYQNGKLLESWTSSATGYKTKLQPGSYRFHTKSAPKGYQLARDFNFAVNRDGSITLGKLQSGDTVTARNGKITVYGDPVSASGVRTAGTAQGGNGKLPKTGDGISPVVYAVGLVAVGAVILGIGIKKRRESVDEVK